MMKELSAQDLESVAGGSRKTDQINQTLTQVTQGIKDLASSQNNNGSSTTTMLVLALAMQNRNQTVVAAPAATTVVAQPAFSFRARIRI